MSFLFPKPPKVVSTPAANPAVQADSAAEATSSSIAAPGSLISTSAQGLTRKARTQKPSLIGSSTSAN